MLLIVQRVEIPRRVLGVFPVKLKLEPVRRLCHFLLNLLAAHVRFFELRELSLLGALVPLLAALSLALTLLLASVLARPVTGVDAVDGAVAFSRLRRALIGESLQRGFLSFLLAHERGLGLGVGFLLALLEELLER